MMDHLQSAHAKIIFSTFQILCSIPMTTEFEAPKVLQYVGPYTLIFRIDNFNFFFQPLAFLLDFISGFLSLDFINTECSGVSFQIIL